MHSVLFYVTTRPGQEQAMRELAARMMQASRAEGPGCVAYTFHQQKDDPRRFMLYEQWADDAALRAHHVNMKRQFGEPPPGAQLPAQLQELVEGYKVVWYDAVVPA